jgi:zinc transporter
MTQPAPQTTGLIHAILLDAKGGGKRLTWKEVEAWSPDHGTLWIHLDYSTDQARSYIQNHPSIPEIAAEALLAEEPRPRVTPVNQHLLIILRGVNFNPGADPEDMVSVRIWADQHLVISTRKRRLLSISELASELDQGTGAYDAGDVIESLADALIRKMNDVIDDAENRVDDIEDRTVSGTLPGLQREVADLRRHVIALRRYLAPQREALSRLMTEKASWLGDINRIHLRETLERLTRYIENLDTVRDRCLVAHEEIQNRLADLLNRRMYLLSVVTALFLPLGFLTGLLGINLGGIPGADTPHGFPTFLAILAAVISIQLLALRKLKWF